MNGNFPAASRAAGAPSGARAACIAIIIAAFALYCPPGTARAQSIHAALGSEEAELAALLSIIDVETEIATNAKMNADFVPGLVTVLEGNEMEALGARNVWEALRLSPGLEITINNPGNPLVNFRGVGYELHSGQVMIKLNGVPINAQVDGRNFPPLMMPMEQVERIEIIRGPGSALHGGYAYYGVINIVTRSGENRGYLATGSFKSYGGGAMAAYSEPEKRLSVSVNAGYQRSEGPMLGSGNDFFTNNPFPRFDSYAPGPVDERERLGFGSLNLSRGGFRIFAQHFQENKGPYFGVKALHPVLDEPGIKTRHSSAKVSQDFELGPQSRIELYAFGRSDTQEDAHHQFSPPLSGEQAGLANPPQGPAGPGAGPTAQTAPLPPQARPLHSKDGHVLTNYYEEKAVEGGANLYYDAIPSHGILLGASYSVVSVVDAWEKNNLTPEINPVVVGSPGRIVTSLVFQDQYEATESAALTIGARYDKYDDMGERVTPRLAVVWRLAGPHIVKAQYSQAFRPPTFLELYAPQDQPGRMGNPDLKPELSNNYEIAYAYKNPVFTGRAAIYLSQLTEFIRPNPAGNLNGAPSSDRRPRNLGTVTIKGAELEGLLAFSAGWKTRATLSFSNATNENGSRLYGAAAWTGNLTLLGEIMDHLTLGLHLYAVGEREREPGDRRPPLAGYQALNATVSWFNAGGVDGLTLRLGAGNALGADMRAPSMTDSYPADLPRPGAGWLARISYSM